MSEGWVLGGEFWSGGLGFESLVCVGMAYVVSICYSLA